MGKTPQNEFLHKNGPENSESAFNFTNNSIKTCVPSLEFKKKIKKVEKGVF